MGLVTDPRTEGRGTTDVWDSGAVDGSLEDPGHVSIGRGDVGGTGIRSFSRVGTDLFQDPLPCLFPSKTPPTPPRTSRPPTVHAHH